MRSITARDREFSTDVNDTISASSSRPKPTRKAARAPSVAYPCPQHGRAKRQPTSTHGENGRTRLGTDKPTKPINTPDDSTSTAQLLHPPSANCDCHASILASLASRDWSDAKNSMTSASPFIAAKRRVSGLELVQFDNLLVWYKLHEASVVRVGVRRRLASPGQRIVRKRDPERAALAGVDRMHMARHTVRYLPLRDRPGVE